MSAVRVVFVLWGGLFLALGPLQASEIGDLYWQRWLGDLISQTHRLPTALGHETFTAAGAPWVPQEWFFSALVASSMRFDLFVLFAIVVSCIPVAILASVYLRSRQSAAPMAIAIALLFCGTALLESFGVRAQVLGWGCLAAFMLLLERRDRWSYAAIAVVVCWANVHASVMIAPAILAARVLASIADGKVWSVQARRDVLMLPLACVATLCTPLGWRLPSYALSLVGSPIRHFIIEWQPPGLHNGSFLLGALPIVALILAGGIATLRADKLRVFPAVLVGITMLFASRNVPLFAIVAAPLAAMGISGRFPRLAGLEERVNALERPALVSIGVAVVLSAFVLVLGQRYGPPSLPTAAIAAVAANGAKHRLLCEDFAWCSIALAYPTVRVFMDGRCDPFPLDVWKAYIAAIQVKPSWRLALTAYGADSVLTARRSPLATVMRRERSWRVMFEDSGYVVFVRI